MSQTVGNTSSTVDKVAVGLSNVDNTSDANKPVSTAQATAIAATRRGIIHIGHATLDPTNGLTYYMGARMHQAPTTSEAARRIYLPVATTISTVTIQVYTTVASTGGQTATFEVYLNNTTATSIGTHALNTTAGYNVVTGTVNVAVGAGEFFTLRMACPTWTTPPTGCFLQATVVIIN